jgi:hypothetical protein
VVHGKALEQRSGPQGVRFEGGVVIERCQRQRDRPVVRSCEGGRLSGPHEQLLTRHSVDGRRDGRPQAQRQVKMSGGIAVREHPFRFSPGA